MTPADRFIQTYKPIISPSSETVEGFHPNYPLQSAFSHIQGGGQVMDQWPVWKKSSQTTQIWKKKKRIFPHGVEMKLKIYSG